ncbi:MAG: penicillin-binding protein activator LpoB [Candidatus Latescibacteria bacterium 4484_7]|nr:MAG: penicillin-binding protein activator LpoB [Candidatus Latescibacteria bacterium 4484_7]RKZ07605.1 MAG: penicillin-binding protein activator LpoB [bacterium]
MRRFVFVLALASLVLAFGCAHTVKVQRIEPGAVTDLSGTWNDTDSRLVAEEMVKDCLSRPWLGEFTGKYGKKPVVIVGFVQNKSYEHIAVETFVNDLQRELINSGRVSFVADKDIREALRDEKVDQSHYSSPETMKKMGRELGADFMLFGSINSIIDQIEGKKVIFYQVDLELINIETNEKVWIGQKKIKKYIAKDKFKI